MNKQLARSIALDALRPMRLKTYSELIALIDKPITSEVTGADGTHYQIEINIFWDSHKHRDIRVLAAVDDGKWSAFSPLTEDFIMRSVGTFIDEPEQGQ